MGLVPLKNSQEKDHLSLTPTGGCGKAFVSKPGQRLPAEHSLDSMYVWMSGDLRPPGL